VSTSAAYATASSSSSGYGRCIDADTPPFVNPVAPAIAERLAAAFADVEHRVEIDEYGELLLEIPCPSPSVDTGLWISTFSTDVVVGFHTQHSHFGEGWDYGDRDHVDEAIAVAREWLAERMVVVSWYRDGEPGTATRVWPEEASTQVRDGTKEIFDLSQRLRLLLNGHLPRRGRVDVTIRSWAGTHDADFADVR
jgi:hypothetical protein